MNSSEGFGSTRTCLFSIPRGLPATAHVASTRGIKEQGSADEMVNRGAFIVFEGCDRSGKSTQSLRLAAALESQGIPTKHLHFPGSAFPRKITMWTFHTDCGLDRATLTGRLINDYLKCSAEMDDRALHLLFSANRWESSFVFAEVVKTFLGC